MQDHPVRELCLHTLGLCPNRKILPLARCATTRSYFYTYNHYITCYLGNITVEEPICCLVNRLYCIYNRFHDPKSVQSCLYNRNSWYPVNIHIPILWQDVNQQVLGSRDCLQAHHWCSLVGGGSMEDLSTGHEIKNLEASP